MDLFEIENKLFEIPFFGKKVGHKNIERMLEEIESYVPLKSYLDQVPVIHVTGTNGKGSVCKMLSILYTGQGHQVGLFTSPHIDHITERIQICNQNIDGDTFAWAYEIIKKISAQLGKEDLYPTFFEWMFAIALLCFYHKKSDFLVIEVGIGGRLDTTNVLPKKVLSVLTPIGMDHQKILGDTIEEVAKEKAGIIKNSGKVVYYNDKEVVMEVIGKAAEDFGARIYPVLPLTKKIHRFEDKRIDFSIHNKYYNYEKLLLNNGALFQIDNVAIVLTCIYALQEDYPISEQEIRRGIEAFYWPGRYENIFPDIFIDGAHNVHGVKALLETLKDSINNSFPSKEENKVYELLIGFKEGKDFSEMVKLFLESNIFQTIYITGLSMQKSVSRESIYQAIDQQVSAQEMEHIHIIEDTKEFLYSFVKREKRPVLIGTGSLYLVSEIRNYIQQYRLQTEDKNDSI